jgi:ribonuclease P protein component
MHAATEPSSPNSTPRLRFARSSRLLKHSSFERIYKDGRRHFSPSMTFFYTLRTTLGASDPMTPHAQVGFTVGRVLGGSVERNRIRRRVRDAVRLNLPALNQALAQRELAAEIVINPKKSAIKAEHTVLRSEVARAFNVIAAAKHSPERTEKGQP